MKRKQILLPIIALLSIAGLASCTSKGEQGPKGDKGDQGVPGEVGPKGDKGDPGEDGVDGVDGKGGTDGKDGVDGKDGADGKDGQDGVDGKDGADGKDGQDGVDGKDGTDGKDGVDGQDGTDGNDGEPGKSAYEIFKEHYPHYTKTEREWVDDLANGTLKPTYWHNHTYQIAYPDDSNLVTIVDFCDECDCYVTEGVINSMEIPGTGSYSYNVLSFVTGEGNDIVPMFIENGVVVGSIPDATLEGKYFEGWYLDPDFTKKYTEDFVFTTDTVLYATYSDPITVTFEVDGGDEIDPISFQINTTPEIPTPTKDNWKFEGWFTDEDRTVPYVKGPATKSFTLYASWSFMHELYGDYAGFKFMPNSSSSISSEYSDLDIDSDGFYSLQVGESSYETGKLGEASSNNAISSNNNGNLYVFSDNSVIFMHEGSSYSVSSYIHVLFKDGSPTTANAVAKCFDLVTFVKFDVNGSSVIAMIDNQTGVVTYDVSIVNSKNFVVNFDDLGTACGDAMYFKVMKGKTLIDEFGYTDTDTLSREFTNPKGAFTAEDGKVITFSGTGRAYFDVVEFTAASYVSYDEARKAYCVYYLTHYYLVNLDESNHTFNYQVKVIRITLDSNGGRFKPKPDDGSSGAIWATHDHEAGQPFDVEDYMSSMWMMYVQLVRPGYTFEGFYDAEEGGNRVTVAYPTEPVTYYAHWVQD